ncbi:MAG: hypothetical protein ACOX8R_04240 [Bacillota bacterium]|jgi:hypothetical protein
MNALKRCLRYLLIVFAPLICLKLAAVFISGAYDRTAVRMILIYSVILLLTLLVGQWRLRKFELLLPLIPMAALSVLCVTPQTFNTWTLAPSPFGSYVIFMFTHFWAGQGLACMLFAAGLVKILLDLGLNLRDAAQKGKDAETAADGGGEEEADAPDMG